MLVMVVVVLCVCARACVCGYIKTTVQDRRMVSIKVE